MAPNQTSTGTMPTILIIVGITGDLAGRKLLPAVERLAAAGILPNDFRILGISRQPNLSKEDVLGSTGIMPFVGEHLSVLSMDMNDLEAYKTLQAALEEIETTFSAPAQRLFYLSIPPRASMSVIEMLGTSGMASMPHTKLLLEKPFGTNLSSATEMVARISEYFTPEQEYRIDHYLAKEMAQNVIVFREHNPLFRETWNKDFIERIEIVAHEKIGIEGRKDFYEQTGALRDLVQSHLLQLAALTLMNVTPGEGMGDLPKRRLAALQQLRLSERKNDSTTSFRRGQYRGYRDEVENPESVVETYVELELESTDPAFAGVPITLATGKNLDRKATEIRIYYKHGKGSETNELVMRIQPNEGIGVGIWSKRLGYERTAEMKTLEFMYGDRSTPLVEAYENVLADTIRSDRSQFVSSQEVLESWRIIRPIQEAWNASPEDLFLYEPGSALVPHIHTI